MNAGSKVVKRAVAPTVGLGTFSINKGDCLLEIVTDVAFLKGLSVVSEVAGKNPEKPMVYLKYSVTLDVDGTTLFASVFKGFKPEQVDRMEQFRAVHAQQADQLAAAEELAAGKAFGISLGEGRIIRGKFSPWIASGGEGEAASVVNKLEWQLMPREYEIIILEEGSVL